MPKGLQRALVTLLTALTLYALLGFLILPGIALRLVNQQLAAFANVPARLERLQLNPFTLELQLWGLHIGPAEAEQLGFARLYADLELDSLWSGALHLRDIQLERPHIELLLAKDGGVNLTQLFTLPPSPPPAADAAPSTLPPLRIERLALIEGGLHFEDLRPSTPIEFVYDSLNLELHTLSTLPEENADLSLVARGPHGGQLDWRGQLSLLPLRSSGHLQLQDGQLKAIWPYVRDALPLELESGALHLSTDYRLDLADNTQLTLDQLTVGLSALALNDPQQRPLLRLGSLDIAASSLDLATQTISLGQLRSQQLETWVAREADGQLDWQKLLGSTPAPQPAPVAASAAPAPTAPATQPADAGAAAAPAKPWRILLADAQLRDYRIHLADRQPAEDVSIEVGPLNLDLSHFDSLAQAPFALKLDTGLGKQGHLTAAGQVQLDPPQATLQVSTDNIDLRLAQAYISPFMRLELRSGLLASQLQVQLQQVEPLQLQISGDVRVTQLHTLDTLKERDFLRWQQLQLQGLDYQHGKRLKIGQVALNQPYVRFIINEDRSTNINDLLIPQPASAAPVRPAAEPSPPLAIEIGGIRLADGSANFADFSLTPNFATAIQQLQGSIGAIDSQQPKPARVDIQGKVDRYAPVSIKGSLNPFEPLDSLDIATRFKQVELTTLTPYSGKFAGYRIKKGRLNLDLHYRIQRGQLQADNKLVLEQLQLGEQVDSPDAVDLPIRLAIALLKDPEGKIDIELPIAGDLNNPEFSVAPIIWQTLKNLVLRAVQAPFNFIAGLAGGSDVDLSQVDFAAGEATLDESAQGRLDQLADALKQRPQLILEVQGSSSTVADGPPLAAERLQTEYQRIWYQMQQRAGEQVPPSAAEIQVPEDEKPAMLAGIYRARLKQQPPAEWAELDSTLRADRMKEAVLASWANSDLLLRTLAQRRAASVKDYLVGKGGLADQRIYLIDARVLPDAVQPDGLVATQLQLDSP